VEHHKALGLLLERLQRCQRPEQVLEELIEVTASLSWMRVAIAAAAFLMRDGALHLVASRNLTPDAFERCGRLEGSVCVCGRVGAAGQPLVLTAEEVAAQIPTTSTARNPTGTPPFRWPTSGASSGWSTSRFRPRAC